MKIEFEISDKEELGNALNNAIIALEDIKGKFFYGAISQLSSKWYEWYKKHNENSYACEKILAGRMKLLNDLLYEIDKCKENTDEWIKINPQDDSTYPKEQTQVIVSIHDDSGDTPYDYTASGWHVLKIWIVDNEINYHVIAWRPFPIPLKIKKEA